VYNVYDTLYNGLNEDTTCMVAIEIRETILTLANFYLYRDK